jgi:hypothetical protein
LDDYADDEGIVLGLESCCRVSWLRWRG